MHAEGMKEKSNDKWWIDDHRFSPCAFISTEFTADRISLQLKFSD